MKKPVVLIVMDGVGYTDNNYGNAVNNAYTPNLEYLEKNASFTTIKAHGTAVGLPSDEDMGNSEVGHNAIGCGQIYAQGAKLVNASILSKEIYHSDTWNGLKAQAQDHTLHFIGLLSDGNVHSHIDQLLDLIRQAKEDAVKQVRVHILLDGRDVPETSALIYVQQLEDALSKLNDVNFNALIASGGGRMKVTMDRYEADWSMVELGWKTHVLGEGRSFTSAKEAIETYRIEGQYTDQFLPAFVIQNKGKPVGTIQDGDAVIFFNFRGDRAIEISKAFEQGAEFKYFDRKRIPTVFFAGMLQYDGDLQIPKKFLVSPPHITNTLSELLVKHKVTQYALSETQKYGHVTYFWNGNRTEKFDDKLETYVEIKSDLVPFEQRPWMKAADITDALIEAIESGKYGFLRVNYPNGDMVGHTGSYPATIVGVETVDLQLGRLLPIIRKHDAILIVTADHGNADEMYEKSKDPNAAPKAKTAHTLSPVPFFVYNANVKFKYGNFGLANIASTVTDLLGIQKDPIWLESIIDKHD
jgi:2,3-bisphosphoglycerate-independent phosphoglycerate mutase